MGVWGLGLAPEPLCSAAGLLQLQLRFPAWFQKAKTLYPETLNPEP